MIKFIHCYDAKSAEMFKEKGCKLIQCYERNKNTVWIFEYKEEVVKLLQFSNTPFYVSDRLNF